MQVARTCTHAPADTLTSLISENDKFAKLSIQPVKHSPHSDHPAEIQQRKKAE